MKDFKNYRIQMCDFEGAEITKIPHAPEVDWYHYEYFQNIEDAKTNAIRFLFERNGEMVARIKAFKKDMTKFRNLQARHFLILVEDA